MQRAMEAPASPLGDRYQWDGLIAVGGMGEVWRATDLVLGRAVAVKLLRSGCAGSDEDQARFRAEARHAGSLSHPGVAQVYDYHESDPPHPPCLVMELVDGQSLARVLDDGPIAPARAMDLIAQAAAALQAAHAAGLVHRDIKPGNLLVSQDGDVKITDFGIAHAAGSASVTRPGTMFGTPAYLAPERAAGAPATPAADLYALGIVAHQCLTGRVPFEGAPLAVALAHLDQPLPPLPPDVPAGVAALVAALTAKDPRARPADAGEVAERAERLRDALTEAPLGPPRLPPAALAAAKMDIRTATWPLPLPLVLPGVRQPGRPHRRVLAGLNAVVVCAALAAAGWGISGGHHAESGAPAATQRPGPQPSHSTHPAKPARRNATGAYAPGPVGLSRSEAARKRHAARAAAKPSPRPIQTPAPSGMPAPSGAPSPTATPTSSGTPSPSGIPSPTTTRHRPTRPRPDRAPA